MMLKNFRGFGWLFGVMVFLSLACGSDIDVEVIPSDATAVFVVANSSLQPWLETAVDQFNETETETPDGNPAYVQVDYIDSGSAIEAIDGQTAVWLPEEPVWTAVLAEQGNPAFQNNCTSVATSPLVIGMWRDVAESLGWPGLPLGWLDVGSLAADPSAWNYYSGGIYGSRFRLGHTHPGLSGSGASTLLAVVQAAQSKTTAVSTVDIQEPIVQASVGAFEGGVTWFSSNTASLGSTMAERGTSFLGAGIMYESDVLAYGDGNIVPVYPLEGTFVATHPACISDGLDGETAAAAELFRDYLLSAAGQETAVAAGLRPVSTGVRPEGLLSNDIVDLEQPQSIFAPPSVDTIFAVQDVWQAARKDVNLVMLIDTSGSMSGSKMENVRTAAVQFVEQMGDEDIISIIAFSTEPELIVRYAQVGENRQKIINAIQSLQARGDTTLFDAIGDGATLLKETTLPSTANAMVVLSDGEDTRSYRYFFDTNLIRHVLETESTVFTIAYGSGASVDVLNGIATQTNGNFFAGDTASIAAIYEEMSAAFGGSVGVGR